jgi:hypothetical protein
MRIGRWCSVTVVFALACQAACAAEPDLSTPQGARRAYDQARHDGDAAAMKAVAIYHPAWEKLIDAVAASERQTANLRTAAHDRWGAAAAKGVFPELIVDELEGTSYDLAGESAALKFRGTVVRRFKKVDGKWKVDLLTPLSPDFPDDPEGMIRSCDATAKAAASVAGQISSGKFKTPSEACQAFDDLAAVLFDPSSATTRPATSAPTTRPAGSPKHDGP